MGLPKSKRQLLKEVGVEGHIEYSSFFKDVVKAMKKDKLSLVALAVIIMVILVALFAPIIAPYDIAAQDLDNILSGSTGDHILGTDHLGRDIFSRIVYGTRVSLLVGVVAVSIFTVLGIFFGSLAGYHGGIVDAVISRFMEILASFPMILFAMGIMFALGTGVINVFIAIGIVGWTGVARIIRGNILQLKESEFINAAIISGSSSSRIIFTHLLPNCLPMIIIIVMMNIPACIMAEAGLSFLGIGIQPPDPSWGSMVSIAKRYIRTNPTLSIYPGLAIIITVFAFNIFGDGLRDALDPKTRN